MNHHAVLVQDSRKRGIFGEAVRMISLRGKTHSYSSLRKPKNSARFLQWEWILDP